LPAARFRARSPDGCISGPLGAIFPRRPTYRGLHGRRHLDRVRHPGFPLAWRRLVEDEADLFQEFVGSEAKRREAWTRVFSGAAGWVGKEPNSGHMAVARLVHAGKATSVITQNVDNLHQASGVPDRQVIELHGNASYAKCLECGQRHELEELRPIFVDRGEIPMCRVCGGLVKSATISFGQQMPEEPMLQAEAETQLSDLFLVLGSSLVVTPAALFPAKAKQYGARLVIVNREPTPLDDIADLVLHDEIGPTMTAAMRHFN
jgi:NAD-dependent deacetylase